MNVSSFLARFRPQLKPAKGESQLRTTPLRGVALGRSIQDQSRLPLAVARSPREGGGPQLALLRQLKADEIAHRESSFEAAHGVD